MEKPACSCGHGGKGDVKMDNLLFLIALPTKDKHFENVENMLLERL